MLPRVHPERARKEVSHCSCFHSCFEREVGAEIVTCRIFKVRGEKAAADGQEEQVPEESDACLSQVLQC